jgi:lactate racemase
VAARYWRKRARRLKTADAIEAELKEHFVIGANKAYAVTRLTRKAHFILVTGLDKQLAKDMLFTDAVDSVEKALQEAEKIVGKDYKILLMPTGSLTVPLCDGEE